MLQYCHHFAFNTLSHVTLTHRLFLLVLLILMSEWRVCFRSVVITDLDQDATNW